MNRYFAFLFLFSLGFIFFMNFTSASSYGYGNIGSGINVDTSTTNTYYNGTNINISSTTCSGTDKVVSINNVTGAVTCDSDVGGAYDDSWINGTIDTKISTNNNSVNSYILYVNSTNTGGSYDDSWINSTFFNQSTILGFGYYNSTSFNINNYALLSVLNNGSYFNPDLTTYITQSIINNGTYIIDSILNNGTYSATGTDSFAGNYSQFLINTAITTNGTFALNSALSNYALLSVLNNGTYSQGGSDSTWVANWSAYNSTWSSTTNATYNTAYLLATNGTFQPIGNYLTEETNWNNNYSQFLVNTAITTNGTFLTSYTETDPKWTANYSAFLNKVNWADVNNGTITASETQWNNNYSQFLVNIALTTNGTFALSSALSSYALLSVLNNGTYTNPDLTNYITQSILNNGTYIIDSILNNGTYSQQTGSGQNFWIDGGAYIYPNSTYADNVNVTGNLTIGTSTNSLSIKYNGTTDVFDTLNNNAYFKDNVTVEERFKLNSGTCGNMVSGEICRNSTGVFIKG